MLKHSLTLLAILGVLIALFSFGVDYLLPGTSPGFNLPQLLIVGAGLALTLVATQLRRQDRRRRLAGLRGKAFAAAAFIALLTLLVLEIVLTLWGMPTYFPSEVSTSTVEVAPWWICDELGCHYHYESVIAACADDIIAGRECLVNRQGLADTQDFIVEEDFPERVRILMMGDSFTQGYSADIGKSYVETLEAAFLEAIVWNTALAGTGTNRAVTMYERFAPRLNPQLSVLGFVMNDFRDNVESHHGWLKLQDSDGQLHFVRRMQPERWGNNIELKSQVDYAYVLQGSRPPTSELERITGSTGLGTLALRALDMLSNQFLLSSFEHQAELTRQYLAQLRDAAAALDSSLLVILIPRPIDIGDPGEEYQKAIQLMELLKIPYLNPIGILDPTADYAPPPDGHWNNSGHQKIGVLLRDCVERFFASGDLADCDNVIMP